MIFWLSRDQSKYNDMAFWQILTRRFFYIHTRPPDANSKHKKRKDSFSEKMVYSTRIGCTPRQSAADYCRKRRFSQKPSLRFLGIAEYRVHVWWSGYLSRTVKAISITKEAFSA
jgi:hypothetical protein